jgi:hypothetical protein
MSDWKGMLDADWAGDATNRLQFPTRQCDRFQGALLSGRDTSEKVANQEEENSGETG